MMVGTEKFLHNVDVARIGIRLKFPRYKIFFIIFIIHRKGIQGLPQFPGADSTDQAGIQAS